ncbi:MAG: hypothetical protein NT005_07600 [Spirochaetes bacterium]|nr:hypothetical protein [Spirochaetota bacterium]
MMSSRRRVLDAARHRETDRVPLDYWSREDVTARLCAHLGVRDEEALYRRLGIDLRGIPIHEHHEEFEQKVTGTLGGFSECAGGRFIIHEDGRFEDAWAVVRRLGSDQLYDEWVSGPFVADTNLDSFPWPAGDIFDAVDVVRERVTAWRGEFALLGRLNLPFKIAWHMRGLENFLCDMLLDPSFARELLQRIARYEREKGLRLIRAGVDIVGIYGDIAMQDRMLVHLASWRELEKPLLAEMIAGFKAENPDLLVFFHSDGNTTEVMQDLIEIGVDIVNPIQPECMDDHPPRHSLHPADPALRHRRGRPTRGPGQGADLRPRRRPDPLPVEPVPERYSTGEHSRALRYDPGRDLVTGQRTVRGGAKDSTAVRVPAP